MADNVFRSQIARQLALGMINKIAFSYKGHGVFAQKQITLIGIFKTLVITCMSLIVLMVGAGYLYVNQVGGLSRFLETELSALVGSGTATVGDARISVSLSRQPVKLTASDLVINLDNEQIKLPKRIWDLGGQVYLARTRKPSCYVGSSDLVKKWADGLAPPLFCSSIDLPKMPIKHG